MNRKSFYINKLPYIVSFIVVLFILNCIKNVKQWEREGSVINWDIVSYYAYLPAVFIYHDYKLEFVNDYKGPHKFVFWPRPAPNGGKVIITSMGMSVLYAPFFFLGHAAAYFYDYDTGGFSQPYSLALILSSVFYLALGLFYLSRILLKFFNPYVSSWVILITVFGTNLFYYVTYWSAMSHPYSFALITIFIWYSIRWHEKPCVKYSVIIGLLYGLIVLIRPTNIVLGLFFFLWNVKSIKEFAERVKFFLSKYKEILLMLLFFILVWTPQFLYWKSITGEFFYFSYGQEEKFFFDHPMIIKGLFGYRHGWLIYSPVMIFSLFGMIVLLKRSREMLMPVVFTFLVFIYVIFSWWCWWYGGAFGMRAMIDIYGLLALPMGAFFSIAMEWKKILRWPIVIVSVLLLIVGVHHADKFRNFSSHFDSMTKEAFWDNYLKSKPAPSFDAKLRAPDYLKAREGIDAYLDESTDTQ